MTEAMIDAKTLAAAMRDVMNPTKAEQSALMKREPGRPHTRIACISPCGAKFNAVVAASKEFPDYGRVKALEDYEYPENPFLPGMQPYALDPRGGALTTNLTVEAKSWLYQNTYRADLIAYVGKEFNITIRADLRDKVLAIEAENRAKLHAELDALTAPPAPAAPAPKGQGK